MEKADKVDGERADMEKVDKLVMGIDKINIEKADRVDQLDIGKVDTKNKQSR